MMIPDNAVILRVQEALEEILLLAGYRVEFLGHKISERFASKDKFILYTVKFIGDFPLVDTYATELLRDGAGELGKALSPFRLTSSYLYSEDDEIDTDKDVAYFKAEIYFK